MLHIEDSATTLAKELELYKTLVGSVRQTMLILDEDKYLTGIYNVDEILKTGLSPDYISAGKNLHSFANDESSQVHQICKMLDEVIDKISGTTNTVVLEYKFLNSYLKATVSKIQGNHTLIQIHDITDIMKKLQKLESDSYKELSLALTAGGLRSWSYDIKTNMISSSHQNNITGAQISFDTLLSNIFPEYRQDVREMFDALINRQSQHRTITVKVKDLKGNVQWSDVHAIPHIYDSNGKLSVIVGSQKNVTQEYEYNQKIDLLYKEKELILNNMSSALVYITPDYRVMWENVSKVFSGSSIDKYYVTGTYCYTTFQRDSPCENCVMRQAMQSRKKESTEFTNEAGISIEILANPILGADNMIESIVLKIDDITEKKKTNRKLEMADQKVAATNRLLHTILDNLPSSLFVKNANDDYRYIMVNKKFCQGLDLPEKDIIGKTDYEIFPKKEADRQRLNDTDTMASNQTKIIDGEHVTMKEGVEIWYMVKTPLINLDNDRKLLVGIGVDITENHKAYQELAVAKKKAEESDVLKSAFLANMSHEIRTPLNSIIGFSELLKDSENEEEKKEFWNIINTNNDLLLRLISDILDLSKIESGMVELKSVPFDLSERFNHIYSTLQLRHHNKDVEFFCENPCDKCIVALDESRITQIVTNFVTNAFKFTTKGYIKMGYEYVDGGIRFYCRDTGIGIAPEKINRVFARFSKLDDFAQGTGLGTSICKAIVDACGGKIGVDSVANEGSTFWAWIPCNAEIGHRIVESDLVVPAKKIKPTDFISLKILAAEDNDSNYLLIKSIFKGYNLTRANNGAEALELVKSGDFDLVLMDIRMPVMDGIEATQEIRKFNKDIPIIAVTANAFESDKQEALEAGCNGFISKPISKAKLFETLKGEKVAALCNIK